MCAVFWAVWFEIFFFCRLTDWWNLHKFGQHHISDKNSRKFHGRWGILRTALRYSVSTARRVVLLRPGSLVKDVKASEFLQLDLEACHLSLSHSQWHSMTMLRNRNMLQDAQNMLSICISFYEDRRGRWWFRLFQDLLAKIAMEKSKDTWSSAKAEERGGDLAGCRTGRGRQRFWTGVGTRHPQLPEETQDNCAVDGELGWWIFRRFRGESAIEFLCRVSEESLLSWAVEI